MLKKILLALGLIVVVLLVLIALQPAEYRVVRSTAIAARPGRVFALVNDFHNWDSWSPWAKLDPAMKTTYSGPPAGTGAVYEWTGNDKVGAGRMAIVGTEPNQLVNIKLEFLKPFASTSDTDFSLKPSAGGTAVDWVMVGHNNFMGKAFGLFMNMDKMIGADFEKGLAQMKAVAEAR